MNQRDYFKSIDGASVIKLDDGQSEIVNFITSSGAYASAGFAGRSGKSSYCYSFKADAARRDYEAEWIADRMKQVGAKQRAKAERGLIDVRKEVSVGDIFYNSWGWDQTNVDFYQVRRVTSKTIYCVALKHEFEEYNASGMCGTVVPTEEVKDSKLVAFRCGGRSRFTGELQFNVRYGSLSRFRGKAIGCSWYG
jgi:hypothetical protein